MRRIHDQHAAEKAAKFEKMVEARCVALTGDHWTSVNNNFLGVTVHFIDASWELHCFALDGGFDGALAKCRKVVGHFKHSPANSDELNVQQASLGQVQESLVQDVPTRWNSTLEMIKRVMRNRDALHTTLSKQKHNLALPTNAEYEKLAKLEKLLEPCRYGLQR
ncbi:hypothetical protein DPEC_G00246680 [Dallia pectoralis]|uniref:Uncharacterized protein n=1 Tax=Dallia pectoralis TaxID=75939 RepID=A0ACC2FWQ1_DALPE|nr:hypothetical protein DPEC_G00246680 [Dallia pectoralis]